MGANYKIHTQGADDYLTIRVDGIVEIAEAESLRNDLIQKMESAGKISLKLNLEDEVTVQVLQVLLAAVRHQEKQIAVTLHASDEQKTLIQNAGFDRFIKLT